MTSEIGPILMWTAAGLMLVLLVLSLFGVHVI